MRTRRDVLKYLIALPTAGRVGVSLAVVQLSQIASVQVAAAQGNGGGNGNGNGGGNGGGNGNGGGGGNGGGSGGGNGNGGGTGNGNGNGNGRGNAPDTDARENSSQNGAGGQQSGQTLEVRHSNGITETLRRGRYSMRDNKGRVIVDRPATGKDRSRFQTSP